MVKLGLPSCCSRPGLGWYSTSDAIVGSHRFWTRSDAYDTPGVVLRPAWPCDIRIHGCSDKRAAEFVRWGLSFELSHSGEHANWMRVFLELRFLFHIIFCCRLVSALWLVNFAGRILLYGPLNFKSLINSFVTNFLQVSHLIHEK